MTRRGRVSGASPTGAERRSLLSQVLHYLLDPLAYWLDVKGTDSRPSHSKIFGAISFFLGMFIVWQFFQLHVESERHAMKLASMGLAAPPHGSDLNFLLAFTFLVFVAPFGLAGYRIYANSKAADRQAQALGQVTTAEAQTSAEVAARRAQGGGDYEATL